MATATLSLSVGVGIAVGQGNGGIGTPSAPKLTDVECVQTCAGLRKAGEGSIIRLSGKSLDNVVKVTFKQREGGRIRVDPNFADAQRVRARVPEGAATGTVGVIDSAGNRATTPNRLQIVNASELSDGGNFRLTEARAAPSKTYFFTPPRRRPRISYVFNGDGQTHIRIQVVRLGNGKVVRSWVQKNRQTLTTHTARWNGRTNQGKVAGNGRYRFRVGAVGGGKAETTAESRFKFYQHIFPVRGRPRGWGDGFGAGRGHQGQDIFVRCGTRLVAARGGKVLYNRYHSAAGYYVIIDGQSTGWDYAYMHLQRRSPLRVGQTVRTGQTVGRVGETGNARGCHLHFELWSAPGWYRGGRPMPSVTKHMRRWASWS